MSQYHLLQSKEQLRQKCKKIRLELYNNGHLEEISKEITDKITNLREFKAAKCVMLFYPKKCEINVLGLLEYDKKFFLPRCEKENLAICEYKKGDELSKSEFNVYEPTSNPISNLSTLDLIIVPALCVDKDGFRLGYGGGFYDRFLKNEELKAKTVVVVPDKLLFNEIPKEKCDIKCDVIISA